MSWSNFHSHCHYCDGRGTPEENIQAAIEQDVKMYGFSSHCPVPFENKWSVKVDDLDSYLMDVDLLKDKYSNQIEIYKSLEIDYIPEVISPDSEIIRRSKLDYSLGSVHFVSQFDDGTHWEIDSTTPKFKKGLEEIYHGDIRQVVKDYYSRIRKMVRIACPDIIGHIDKIKIHNSVELFFDEEDKWYKNEVLQTLEEIKKAGATVEVNTRGMYKKLTSEPYPGKMILTELKKMNIPVCLNSDSHQPDDITAQFQNVAELLQIIGFKTVRILKNHQWEDVRFTRQGMDI